MSETDQLRPDLDAAVDAVLPSLTAVGDDAAAASLRRTRLALANQADTRRAPVWGWGFAATAAVIVLASVSLWHRWPPAAGTIVERQPVHPAVVSSPSAPSQPRTLAPMVVTPRIIRPDSLARGSRIAATSTPRVDEAPRPDPLIALARAVQEIPDDAWRSAAEAGGAITVADLSVAPIFVPPLVTPPIADVPPPPPVQGEP